MKTCPKCGNLFEPPHQNQTRIFCSRHCANSRGPMSNEQKLYRSIFAKANPVGAILDPSASKRGGITRGKQLSVQSPKQERICPCGIIFSCVPSNPQIYHNKECAILHGKCGGFQINSTRKHRSIYNEYQMDSGAELKFAKLLDQYNINWVKNTTIFFTFMYPNGKIGKYYPDFYISDYNFWVEVKGKYYCREYDDLRWASVPNLEVIWSNDIKLPKFLADETGNDPA